jgi:hypothetical protein
MHAKMLTSTKSFKFIHAHPTPMKTFERLLCQQIFRPMKSPHLPWCWWSEYTNICVELLDAQIYICIGFTTRYDYNISVEILAVLDVD